MREKSFAKELAELINRHSIDAKFETADDILATVAIDALNAYAKAKQTQERRNNPDADTCDCPACTLRRAMEAKKAARKFFPGAKIELHRIDVPRNNPRNKRRNRNKRNNWKGGNK